MDASPWHATAEGKGMTDIVKPRARERFCFNCGASMGVIEDRYYDRRDTCGSRECEREARDEAAAERDEAHERLDRDMGW